MSQTQLTILVLGMASVTLLCRLLPFAVSPAITGRVARAQWVRYLPIAIVSAVVFPSLLLSPREVVWGPVSLPLLAAIPTALVGIVSRNLLCAVLAGVASLALLRAL